MTLALWGRPRAPAGEAAVGRLWAQEPRSRGLLTQDGRILEVVYPGWPNRDWGPDFRGALLRLGPGAALQAGDVEVELKTSHWRAHGHHRDPGFAGVLLLVVGEDDREGRVPLWGGGWAPVLVLGAGEEGDSALKLGKERPCREAQNRLGRAALAWRLEEAGLARLREKALRLEGELAQEEAGQVLYRGLMGALGYAKNTAPFLELAQRLPLAALDGYLQGKPEPESLCCLWALLLGEAGLLERGQALFPRADGAALVVRWARLGGGPGMGPGAWRAFRIRPDNQPQRRLVALGVLLSRYRQGGLLPGLMGLVAEAAGGPGVAALEAGLSARGPGGAAIGPGRAVALAANIVLPFALAWAGEGSPLGLGALGLFRRLPRREESGRVRALAQELGLALATEAQQQGLYHVLGRHCSRGGCEACPLAL